MKKNTTCLLWIESAGLYAPVPVSTIKALRSKGAVVTEQLGLLGEVLSIRFFDVQKKMEVAP